MKAGDIVEITKCPENYGVFSVGDAAILTHRDEYGDWWAMFGDEEWCIQDGISECRMVDSSPMNTECDALREEIEVLSAENRRLLNDKIDLENQLRMLGLVVHEQEAKYPEAAVRAVWEFAQLEANVQQGFVYYEDYAEEVVRIFTEALQKGE